MKDDTISRAAALNCVYGTSPNKIKGRIAELPSAQLVNIAKLQPNCNQVASDCISRAAVVDAIEGVDWYHMTDSGEMVHGANSAEHQAWYKAEDVYAAIEGVPSTQERWIPCKTRKPDKSGLYLVTKQQKTGEIQLATAHYNTAFDEWSGNGNFKKVLAWMSLPSPWRGEKDA